MSTFAKIMALRRSAALPDGELTVTSDASSYPTPFKIVDVLADVVGAIGVVVNDIWEMRGGHRNALRVSKRAVAAGLKSTQNMQVLGSNGSFDSYKNDEHARMLALTQPYPTKDGRWFLPHLELPELRSRVLRVLDCELTSESIKEAVGVWDALSLEQAIEDVGACGAVVRSNAEWRQHPHGQTLSQQPLIEIAKIGDSDPQPFPKAARPLDGVRVLDLTRILAGPIAARTLAEHGADVLMVTDRDLPQIPEHVLDTSHGKRSSFLNLKRLEQNEMLCDLVRNADVFSQGYRPGAMDRLGFSDQALAKLRPGIVSLSVSCYGHEGPLNHRPGWEQIAQAATGLCYDGGAGTPHLLPAAACDYTTGYLGACGVLLALLRRAREGGSYRVHVSLCRTAMEIIDQGRVLNWAEYSPLSRHELDSLRTQSSCHLGSIKFLRPILQMSETEPFWQRATPKLGQNEPKWLNSPRFVDAVFPNLEARRP